MNFAVDFAVVVGFWWPRTIFDTFLLCQCGISGGWIFICGYSRGWYALIDRA